MADDAWEAERMLEEESAANRNRSTAHQEEERLYKITVRLRGRNEYFREYLGRVTALRRRPVEKKFLARLLLLVLLDWRSAGRVCRVLHRKAIWLVFWRRFVFVDVPHVRQAAAVGAIA